MNMRRYSPVILIFAVAPFVGEILSSSTPIYAVWMFPVESLLYGSSALLIREVVRRRGLGLAGLAALGAAFGLFQEALLLRTVFTRQHLADVMVVEYGRVFGANLLQAVYLMVFHAAVSTWCAIAIVELLLPSWRDRPWAGRRGLLAAGLVLGGLLAVSLIARDHFYALPAWPAYLAAICLTVLLIGGGLQMRGQDRRTGHPPARPRLLAPLIAAAYLTHMALVWTLPHVPASVPWPAAIVAVLIPLALALALAPRVGPARGDARVLAAVTGLIVPLVLSDIVIGLSRPGTLLTAAAGVLALVALRRRVLRRSKSPHFLHGS